MHDSSGDPLECEVAGYIVRARRADAWDAIVTLLVALDAEHCHYFHAVMQGCRCLSNSRPEIDGLDDLLLAPEQHLREVAVERERRRSLQGYATPADAHATDVPESLEAVMELLTEAGVMPERPRAMLEAADADPQAARLTRLRRLMAYVRDTDETAYLTRSRELAFLANTLLRGCSVQS